MKDPIQKYFQVGTIQWMTHPPVNYPILDSVKAICCDEYFSALEITHIEDQKTRDKVRDMLAQSHMKVCYGAQSRLLGPKLNPNDLDEEGRKKAEDILKDSIDEARYMGAGGIAFLAGKWEPETKDQAYAQLLKTTRAVCDYAARFAADMRTTHNNFGLLVDLSHFPTTYETSAFVIRSLRPYITHLHIGNAVVKQGFEAYGDQHPRFGFPDSANDTPQLLDFFTVLKEEGFFNKETPYVLSLEVKPWAEEDGDIILANTKRVINRAWALLED